MWPGKVEDLIRFITPRMLCTFLRSRQHALLAKNLGIGSLLRSRRLGEGARCVTSPNNDCEGDQGIGQKIYS